MLMEERKMQFGATGMKKMDLNQCSGYCNIPGRNITGYRNIKK